MIRKWKQFKESIGGFEIPDTQSIGPNYGKQVLHSTLSSEDTNVILGSDDKFYTIDGYEKKWQELGDPKFPREFNKLNLDTLLQKLSS